MIKFGKLKIEGFGSIPELEIDLGQKGITVIRGSIGTGKSTILSAIVWAVYGKNLKEKSDVNTWSKFQPKGYKGTKVEILFHNGKTLNHIIRCQNYTEKVDKTKGGNRLIYKRDSEEVSEKAKVKIQQLITADIGLSYNLFMNSVMFGQGLNRFIQETSSDKKNIFEEFFDTEFISKARDLSKIRYNEASEEVEDVTDKIIQLKEKREDYEEVVERDKEVSKNFYKEKRHKLRALKNDIKASAMALSELDLNKPKKKFNKKALEKLEKKYDKVEVDLEKANKHFKDIKLEEVINNTIKTLETGGVKGIAKAIESLHKIKHTIDLVPALSRKLSKLSSQMNEARSIEHKWNIWEIKKDSAQKKLTSQEDKLRALKNEEVKVTHENFINKIQTITNQIKKLSKNLEESKNRLELQRWLYTDPLGNNGIKSYLFESSLESLNEILREYSDILGFQILFFIDLYSAKKDIQTQIIMDGVEVSYSELSGGQKQLVNLSVAFAMNEVMNNTKGINITFLDEVFENLNNETIEIVIGLIQRIYKDKTLFLISHHDSLPIHNARVLQVTRHKGLSYYN